jgi:hypothetical protein
MEKIHIKLKSALSVFLLIGICHIASANNLVTVPILKGGFVVGGTGLWFVPASENRITYGSLTLTNSVFVQSGFFALPEDSTTIPSFISGTTTISGPPANSSSLEADQDYNWGFSVHLGYIFPNSGNDVMLNWNHLNSSTTTQAIAPTFTSNRLLLLNVDITQQAPIVTGTSTIRTSGGFISPFIGSTNNMGLSPELGNTAPFSKASAATNTRWDSVDLNFGQHVNIGSNFDLRMFGGIVMARINEELQAAYAGVGISQISATGEISPIGRSAALITNTQYSTTNIEEKSNFKGLGPEIGFDGHYCFTNSNFGMAGHLGTQMLMGNCEANLNFSTRNYGNSLETLTTPTGQGFISQEFLSDNASYFSGYLQDNQNTCLVPEIEANLGLDYTYHFANDCHSSFITEVGYQGTKYFNATRYFNNVNSNNLHADNILFHGPFVTIKFLA